MIHFPTFGLKKLLPKKAVISADERCQLETLKPHQVAYLGQPHTDFPIIPFQIFGLDYEKDIVIATKHPQWNLHEYAQVRLPEGPVWIMKDAQEGTMDQYIALTRDDLRPLIPEIPLSFSVQPAKVTDNSSDTMLDIQFEYENYLGENVSAHYKGKTEMSKMKKRNGSTMGHSKNQLLALLDLPERKFGKKASVTYNNKRYPVRKILGIKPFKMLVRQTQGGICTGEFRFLRRDDKMLHSLHFHDKTYTEKWQSLQNQESCIFKQTNKLRTITYQFDLNNEHCLLKSANVQLWDRDHPAFEIHFFPALPDLRHRFEGAYASTIVMDVNNQPNHGIGKANCHWEEKKLVIDITPEEPWWIADRPMKTVIEFLEGGFLSKTIMM